jgi:hypothetical protein
MLQFCLSGLVGFTGCMLQSYWWIVRTATNFFGQGLPWKFIVFGWSRISCFMELWDYYLVDSVQPLDAVHIFALCLSEINFNILRSNPCFLESVRSKSGMLFRFPSLMCQTHILSFNHSPNISSRAQIMNCQLYFYTTLVTFLWHYSCFTVRGCWPQA